MSLHTPSSLSITGNHGRSLRSCSCKTSLPPSLNHILYHQTTRTPLYIHPSWWSNAHLAVLRIAVESLPPSPKSLLPIPLTSQAAIIQSRIQSGIASHCSVLSIVCFTISTIDYVQHPTYQAFPIFRYFRHSFHLKMGSITTRVKAQMYIEHTGQRNISIPFLAYNDADHRRAQKYRHTRSRRARQQLSYSATSISAENSVIVEPFDVAVLLAMAQVQQKMLPTEKMYKTFLLYPNDGGTHLHLLAAEISAEYLQCLRDTARSLTEYLSITHSDVIISCTGEELVGLIDGIFDSAPTLPPVRKWVYPNRPFRALKPSMGKGKAVETPDAKKVKVMGTPDAKKEDVIVWRRVKRKWLRLQSLME